MRLRFVLITALALSSMHAYAMEDPILQLITARNLKCHFGPGTSTLWLGGRQRSSTTHGGQDFHLALIDIRNQSARVIGSMGARDIKVLPARVGLSFVELTPSFVDLTTVFPIYGKEHDFLAVYTRHEMASGASMAKQYYGSCQVTP
ncbi:MAG: hypothetical protein ACLPXB_07460 [Thiobacillaceae bacterium]